MEYTAIRFKGIVKKQFRNDFECIATGGDWQGSTDKKLRSF